MKNNDLSSHNTMMQFIIGKWISKPIGVVARLGIADLLVDSPKDIATLAAATKTDPASLYRVMRALASVGIFREKATRKFALTPLGQCLTNENLRYQAMMFQSDWHDRAWSGLDHTVKTGEPAFDSVFGQSAFEWLADHPDEAEVHGNAMAANIHSRTEALLKIFDFSPYTVVVDVGGGHGALLTAIVSGYPHMHGVIADLPHVASGAASRLTEEGLLNRCHFEGCNFLESVPEGGDLYILSNVLHDWSDTDCLKILSTIQNSWNSGATILIIEFLLPGKNVFSPAKLLDIEMMVMSQGGRERTEEEFCDLLSQSGLGVETIKMLDNGESMIMVTRCDP